MFREDLQLDTPLCVDTTRASYRALGLKRGISRTLGSWRTWANMFRALREGVQHHACDALEAVGNAKQRQRQESLLR